MGEGWTSQVDEGVEDLRRLGSGAGALGRRGGWRRKIHVQVHGVCGEPATNSWSLLITWSVCSLFS